MKKNNFFPLPDGVTREEMETDILIVGGGSAGLSCALEMARLFESKKASDPSMTAEMPTIMILEKGSEVGAHSLSGAVLNPTALKELMPNYLELGFPFESEVKEDEVHYLSKSSNFKLPITPPPFKNHGNYIVSISKVNRWLGQMCEQKGIMVFPGFAAVEVLYDGDSVVGVRTGDKGRNKDGKPKANFEAGIIVKSKITVFAEGTRGSLFQMHAKKMNLYEGKNPDVYEEGVKEVIQCQKGSIKPGKVIHTLGFPLKKSIGGTFIYTLPDDKIIIGLVAYLDSKDPMLDPHRELQKLKTHPFVMNMIKGGKVLGYGGKTLPAGGWYSMPKLYGNGWMVCGDTASMVDVQKLKGIHLAMKSGMLVAATAMEALAAGKSTQEVLASYEKRIQESFVKKELYRVRNFHQTLSKGMFASLPLIGLQEITGGRGLFDNMKSHVDAKQTQPIASVWSNKDDLEDSIRLPKPDGILFMDKLSSVYLTGTMHDEDSPNHLLLQNGDICRTVCEPQYKSPCTLFCPAAVYEMIPSSEHPSQKELKINYTNCIHCKTCDIKCPFENIDWTTPEGAGGPKYTEV